MKFNCYVACATILAIAGLTIGCGDDVSPLLMGDADVDSMVDESPDTGDDAEDDAEADAEADAGPDAEEDAGPDATEDTGPDATEDTGTDAEDDADMPPMATITSPLLVVTSDFVTTKLATLSTDLEVTLNDMDEADQDTVATHALGDAAVLARTNAELRLHSQADPFAAATTIDISGESASANPQTLIRVSDTKGYVIARGLDDVLVVDLTDGTITDRIDLSGFASPMDMDGVDPQDAAYFGDKLFVGLGRSYLDTMTFATITPEGSVVAVIDTLTDTLIDVDDSDDDIDPIELPANNPFMMTEAGASIVVALTGEFGMEDGGVAVIDSSDYSVEYAAIETGNGDVVGVLPVPVGSTALVLTQPAFPTINVWSLDVGTLTPTPIIMDQTFATTTPDGVWAAGAEGLGLYDAATGDALLSGMTFTFGDLPITDVTYF